MACQGTACSVGDTLVRRSSSERLSISSGEEASSEDLQVFGLFDGLWDSLGKQSPCFC